VEKSEDGIYKNPDKNTVTGSCESQGEVRRNCPANGKYPNTELFCLNEDGSTNCRKNSDCPDETDVCEQPVLSKLKCGEELKTSPVKVCGKVNEFSLDCPTTRCECVEDGAAKTVSSCDGCSGKCGCYTLGQSFGAYELKVTTATSGQSFSGSQGFGVISNRCPSTRPCPYRDGKCGRVVGLGRGGRRAACPRRRF